MIEPKADDVGRAVLYIGNTHPGGEIERGVITSFNEQTVFVRYGDDLHSKGTNPDDLNWEPDEWTIGAAADAWDGGFADNH